MNTYRHITDKQMILVADYIIQHQIKNTATLKEWCESIGIAPNNIPNIKKGTQSFSHIHILNCLSKFNVNANFIYGISPTMFRQSKKENPVQVIKSALTEIEQLLKKKK